MIQKWFRRSLLLIVTLLFSLVLSVSAQGGPLAYGDLVSDTLTPGTPVIHTFAGNPNDLATVYLLTGTSTNVTVSVSNSSGIPLGFSNGDPLTPMPNDARVTALLPATDVYIVTLNNTGDTATSYTLSLTGAQLPPSIPVAGTAPVNIAPQGTAQVLSIPATTIAQTINLQGLTPSSFTAQLYAPDGSVVATVAGGLEAITFSAPAGTGNYTLIIGAVDPTLGTQVNVNILSGGSAPAPASTEEASAPPATDPNVCTVIPSVAGGVNIRSGPGTNYSVIGALAENGTLVVTGQNSGWYTGNYNGQNGWVASSVVTAVGNCNNLQTVAAPPPPQQPEPTTVPPTATTSTDTNTTSPTATTSAPTATTAAPTATATEEVAFVVVSMTCRYFQNDGAYIDYRVEGPPGASFQLEVRFGSTIYSETRTLNDQGFRTGNEEIGSAGNSNYTGYIVYNGIDRANDDC